MVAAGNLGREPRRQDDRDRERRRLLVEELQGFRPLRPQPEHTCRRGVSQPTTVLSGKGKAFLGMARNSIW